MSQVPAIFFFASVLLFFASVYFGGDTRLRAAMWITWFVGFGLLIVTSIGATS